MAAKIAKSATSQATSSVTCIASKGSSISAAAAPHAALLQSLPRPLRFSAFAAICIACAHPSWTTSRRITVILGRIDLKS